MRMEYWLFIGADPSEKTKYPRTLSSLKSFTLVIILTTFVGLLLFYRTRCLSGCIFESSRFWITSFTWYTDAVVCIFVCCLISATMASRHTKYNSPNRLLAQVFSILSTVEHIHLLYRRRIEDKFMVTLRTSVIPQAFQNGFAISPAAHLNTDVQTNIIHLPLFHWVTASWLPAKDNGLSVSSKFSYFWSPSPRG